MPGRLFEPDDAALLESILKNRRDVRGNHFLSDPISNEDIDKLIDAALYSPSVGFSQPWELTAVGISGRGDPIGRPVKVREWTNGENCRFTPIRYLSRIVPNPCFPEAFMEGLQWCSAIANIYSAARGDLFGIP